MTSPVEAQVAVQHYDSIEQAVNGISNSVSFSITSSVIGSVGGMSSRFVLTDSVSTARSGHTPITYRMDALPSQVAFRRIIGL